MMEEKKTCPDCGCEMIKGWIRVHAIRTGSLFWESADKHPQKSTNIFRRGKTVTKKISKYLLGHYTYFSSEAQEEGWYCPHCKMVFARFKTDK